MADFAIDDIFAEFEEDENPLLGLLRKFADALPGGEFFCLDASGLVSNGEPPFVAEEELGRLAERARLEKCLVGGETAAGWFHALELPEMAAVLFCRLSGWGGEQWADPLAAAMLAGCLRQVLLEREVERGAIENIQLTRQISALNTQHQELVEDNFRQYSLLQEQEKEYARTLESEIAQQTAELRQANTRLQEASRLKSEFLANMSHELRTPMNAIIGFSELLVEANLGGEVAEYAVTIQKSGAGLLVLINDILDFAKIEAGKLDISQEPFALRPMMRNVVAMFEQRARGKNLYLHSQIDPRIPEGVVGDENRLKQVLVNLLGNAMKFTESGGMELTVDLVGEAGGKLELRYAVRDTGIGIPEDRQQAIFEKFTQADGSTTRKYGGTGLGLAISTQLVELMGGGIAIQSKVGVGSTFSFTIPMAKVEVVAAATAPSVPAASDAPPLEATAPVSAPPFPVLLVEDNPVNQKLATILLRKQGCQVTVAGDGVEAIEELRKQRFDLVLMDLQMPRMGGLEATRKIRELEASPQRGEYVGLAAATRPLPIVGLSAHARKEDAEEGLAAGMTGFLTKPIVRDKLTAVLREVQGGPAEKG